MIKLFNFKYPKLTGLVFAIFLAYFIFKNPNVDKFIWSLNYLNYLGVFISGFFFSFGFTTPFSVGYFLVLHPENPWLMGVLGGFGAMIADLLIFKFIRFSFKDELNKIKNEKISRRIQKIIVNKITGKIKIYLIYAFAGIIIASPLPDEFGIIMLAGINKIKENMIMIISFLFNTLGIIVLLFL